MRRTNDNKKRVGRLPAAILALAMAICLTASISPQYVSGEENQIETVSSYENTAETTTANTTVAAENGLIATEPSDIQAETNTETAEASENTTAAETTMTNAVSTDSTKSTEVQTEADTTVTAAAEETTVAETSAMDSVSTTVGTTSATIQTETATEVNNNETAVAGKAKASVYSDAGVNVLSESDEEDNTKPPAASKTISDNGDGTYNITLSVTGAQSTTTTSSKFNVVIVADLSGSMSREPDGTSSRDQGYDSTNTRIAAERAALKAFGEQLDTLNAADRDNPTVVARLVTFGSTATLYDENFYDFRDGQSYQTTVGGLQAYSENPEQNSYQGATNWEDAFEKANEATFTNPDSTSRDDLPTYVIFVSDGDPTVRNSQNGRYSDFTIPTVNNPYQFVVFQNDGNFESDPYVYSDYLYVKQLGLFTISDNRFVNISGVNVYGSGIGETSAFLNGTEYKSLLNYNAGLESAKDVKNSGKEIYAVGVYNNVTRMEGLVTELYGSSTDHYYNVDAASGKDGLVSTLESIAKTISSKNYYRNVIIHDHITDLTFADIKINGAETGEFTYQITKDGTTTEWDAATNAATPPASITTDGEVIFNPSSVLTDGVLEDGVTYSVTYRVWPSQEALDTVAELNNGNIENYDDLDQSIKDQILPPDSEKNYYRLKTNVDNVDSDVTHGTYVEYDRYTEKTVTGGETTYNSVSGKNAVTNPDPIPLWYTTITITKTWDSSVDPDEENIKSITLNLIQDGDTENPYISEITLTKDSSGVWKAEENVAVGVIGRDPADLKDSSITDKTRQILEDGHDYTLDEITITYNDGTTKTPTAAGFEFSTDSVHPMLDDWEKEKQSDGTYNLLDYTVVNLTSVDPVTVSTDWAFTLTSTNSKNYIDLPLTKVDSETQNAFSDIKFSLYKAAVDDDGNWTQDGDAIQTDITSGTDGSFTITKLTEGNYLLVETSGKAGYQTPENPWRIEVVKGSDGKLTATVTAYKDGQWVAISDSKIENVPVDYTLPSTGGVGSLPFEAAGIAIMTFAVSIYIYVFKSRKEGGFRS